MHRPLAHYSLLLLTIGLLSACGFQLRGTGVGGTALPESWKNMYLVSGNPNSEFSRDVTNLFTANDVTWTDVRDDAAFSLVLGGEQFEQRNLSLNSEARVAEFELTMSAEFSVLDAKKSEVMPPTTVSVVKRMQSDPRNVVGKTGEMQMLKVEMRSELAQQILQRVSFYAAVTQANPQ